MSMAEIITVATANTHMGRMVRDPDGLTPFVNVDVLLMQEVHPERDNIERRLSEETDMRLVHSIGEYGLAIAARNNFDVQSISGIALQERPKLLQAVFSAGGESSITAFRLRARGMLRVMLATPKGNSLSVATTHPTVPVLPLSRSRQVTRLGEVLSNFDGPFIIGGDMNHWPGPRDVDVEMCERAGLRRVDLDGETTYRIEDSNHSWMGRVAFLRDRAGGELDAMLYKGGSLALMSSNVVDIASDHRAIISNFKLRSDR